MAKTYQLISGDSHINEPPDLWTSRVRPKFKDRAPRMERLEKGDAWIMEGSPGPINFGNNANGGLPAEQRSAWMRWDEIRKGGFVPAVRLAEQAQDGVEAEVLFPTPRISHNVFANNGDAEFHLDCIRAYNDWLGEYVGHAPDRLAGIAMIPTTGTAHAVAELTRAMSLPGMRGALIGRYPNGSMEPSPADDPFWARAAELGVPVHIHVSLAEAPSDNDPERKKAGARGELRHLDASLRTYELICAGIFLATLLVNSGYYLWTGGAAYGARFMVDTVHPSKRSDRMISSTRFLSRSADAPMTPTMFKRTLLSDGTKPSSDGAGHPVAWATDPAPTGWNVGHEAHARIDRTQPGSLNPGFAARRPFPRGSVRWT